MTLQLKPSECPYIWGKFRFLFLSVYIVRDYRGGHYSFSQIVLCFSKRERILNKKKGLYQENCDFIWRPTWLLRNGGEPVLPTATRQCVKLNSWPSSKLTTFLIKGEILLARSSGVPVWQWKKSYWLILAGAEGGGGAPVSQYSW